MFYLFVEVEFLILYVVRNDGGLFVRLMNRCSNFRISYAMWDLVKFSVPLADRIYGSRWTNSGSMITFLSDVGCKKTTDTRTPAN